MRRTYRSKKETGGTLDPRDVLHSMDPKCSVFDAFYIQNIKQTKRDMSVGSSMQFAASNKVRKRKYVKRLKDQEPVIKETMSRSAYLTPDKSFHVKKAPDLFDQLLNSSINNESGHVNTNVLKLEAKPEKKTYSPRKRFRCKKYNYSSSDSTESDTENSYIGKANKVTQNTSDIKNYKLLIEKENVPTVNYVDESINNIVQNLSLFNNTQSVVCESPRFSIINDSKLKQKLQNSPLCSTPFHEKYRGKSIYKFSPISMNLNDSPENLTITEKIDDDKQDISLIVVKDDKEEGVNVPQEDVFVETGKLEETVSVNCIQVYDEIQSPILPNKTVQKQYQTRLSFEKNPSSTTETTSLQTTEMEPFLGFSHTKIDKISDLKVVINKLKDTEYVDMSNENINEMANQQFCDLEKDDLEGNSDVEETSLINNTSTEKIDNCSQENADSLSFYDTCTSEEEFEDPKEVIKQKEPLIIIEKLNHSLFQNYYEKMADFSLESNNEESDHSSSDNIDSDRYASFKENENNLSDKSLSDFENEIILEQYPSTKADSTDSDHDKDSSKTEEEVCISFVTTRRRNEVTNDSFILALDNSIISTSSSNFNKTVLSNNTNIINEENEDLLINDEIVENSLEKENMSIERSPLANFSKLPDTLRSCISNRNSEATISRKTRHSMSPKNLTLCDDIPQPKIMTRKSYKLMRESVGAKNIKRLQQQNEDNQNFTDIEADNSLLKCDVKQAIKLQPGKRWERSLSIYRRMTTMADHFDHSILDEEPLQTKGRKYRQSVIDTMEMQEFKDSLHNESISSRRSTFVSKPSRSTIKILKDPNASRLSLNSVTLADDLKGYLTEDCDDTIVELSKLSIVDSEHEITIIEKFHDASNRVPTPRDYVLRRCNQTDVVPFDECYPDTVLKNCRKIGEGVYGEVFLWRAGDGRARVLKIIPIAGTIKVNGENQKDFSEIISEIVIAMELSALRAPIPEIESHFNEGKSVETLDLHSVENATDVFNEVLAVRCVYGSYPSRLLDLWDLYDECKGSENDNPAVLPVDQQYIVLELANAGQDLESYQFHNAEQAYALFKQVAFGLAVAEEAHQFEHRDLHWGNVLISPTDQKYATFVLRGRTVRVARRGVAATVIDYSLSRLALRTPAGPAALYNDLAADEALFDAVGDYQFQVYRLMRDKLGNDWQNFEPYTNILWLHYTVDKMITALRYTRTNTKIHKHYIAKLKEIKNRILDYGSAAQYVLTDNEL